MKQGRGLQELAQEIERQAEAKRDYLVQTDSGVEAIPSPEAGGIQLAVQGNGLVPLNDHAHGQMAQNLQIPRPYYERMREQQPELLATNVNAWLKHEPKARMLRTLDGIGRAWLSDRYRPLDNIDFAEAILPIISDLDLIILSSEITERRLYIKAVDKKIELDIPTGRSLGDGSHTFFDTISPAMIFSNSEVGAGALALEVGIWTSLCTNLAIASQRSLRKYHVGGRHEMGEEVAALLSFDTREKIDQATWAQVGDVVRGAFDLARFEALAGELRDAAQDPIHADPVKVIEATGKQLRLNEGEKSSVLQHLIRGGDLSRYGLHAAVTRSAEDAKDYDRATELERAGWSVIEMDQREWGKLAHAA